MYFIINCKWFSFSFIIHMAMKFIFSPQENLVFMKLHFFYLSQVNLIIYCLWLSYKMCLLFTELSLRLLHCITVFVSLMKTIVYVLQWRFFAHFAGMRDELVSLCCSASTQQEQIFHEVWTQEKFKILIWVYFCWLFHLWNRLVALFRLMREPVWLYYNRNKALVKSHDVLVNHMLYECSYVSSYLKYALSYYTAIPDHWQGSKYTTYYSNVQRIELQNVKSGKCLYSGWEKLSWN
jgi:hypothetical protein